MTTTETWYGVYERNETGSSYSMHRVRSDAVADAKRLNKEWRSRTPFIVLLILWCLQSYPKWGVREEPVQIWTPEEEAEWNANSD